MKKKILKITAIFFFAVLATSCSKKIMTETESQSKTDVVEKSETAVQSKKGKSFANKVYEVLDEEFYQNQIIFTDSDFCAMGLGLGYYTYDKKDQKITINSAMSNDKETLKYDPKNDTLISEEGFVFKYTRECT